MKRLLSTTLMCLFFFRIFAQTTPTNFYNFLDQFLSNPANVPAENGESELGFYEEVKRQEKIWSPRLYPSGDFNTAANAMYNYALSFNNQTLCANQNPLTKHWTCLGPTGMPSGSNGVGQIHRITFDPKYNTIVNGVLNKVIYCSSPHSSSSEAKAVRM